MKDISIQLLLILMLALGASCGRQQDKTTADGGRDETVQIANDLSNQKITSFAEDADGHIWIGTFRGLNKFDVHEYHHYFCTDDTMSIADNQINDIHRDRRGRLWVATVNGLCLYTDRDNFRRIPQSYSNRNGLKILETADGRILVSLMHQLCAYDERTDSLRLVIENFDPDHTFMQRSYIDPLNRLWTVSPKRIRCYNTTTFELEYSVATPVPATFSWMQTDGVLWLAGGHRIVLFDTRKRSVIPTPQAVASNRQLMQDDIDCMTAYTGRSLLISAGRAGLFLYDPASGRLVHQGERGFPFEAPGFKVSRMFMDSRKNLWIGSVDQGYTVRYSYRERFNTDNYLRQRMDGKSVVSLAVSRGGDMWICTLMDGVFVYNTKTHEVKAVAVPPLKSVFGTGAAAVSQIFVDGGNNIWLLSQQGGKVMRCRYDGGALRVEASFDVFMPMSAAEDAHGTMWFGTCTTTVYALKKGARTLTPVVLARPVGTFTPGLLPMGRRSLWVTMFMKKVLNINTETMKVSPAPISKADWDSCISRSVFIPTAIMKDSRGDVWLGTVTNGLLRYTAADHRLRTVSGTPCRDISGIEEDRSGNIWVSTQYGLGKYDRRTGEFTNYYSADGIGGNQFYDRSSCRLADGTLVFGGTHGLTVFSPADVSVKRNVKLVFEDLKIHNRLVRPSEGGAIDRSLSCRPVVRLGHDENGFSISFSALDYCEHQRVHYYYKMDGFDRYWIDARNNREAYYANLPAGRYKFKVKVTNNDKSITETESSLDVVVSPAPWVSWWAWCLYICVAGGAAWFVVRLRLKVRREKKAALRAEAERQQEQRVNKMNMSFFANVSHEFRTPLTMISGPVAQLCESSSISGTDKALLNIVRRSVARMLRLVNQMLDFNKLENDTLPLSVRRADIISQLKDIAGVFAANAAEKGIDFRTNGLEDTFLMWLDADKMDKIVGNLLSNALKFTQRGGRVDLSFDAADGYARITVADTGSGIPEGQIEKIFERYYQADNQGDGKYNWGTGIGLYYARSLAQLHHGTLTASNRTDGHGAVFTLLLPVADEAYGEAEHAADSRRQDKAFPLDKVKPGLGDVAGQSDYDQDCLPTVLLVDDDTEVVHYLRTLLSPMFRIVCRFDAGSAYQSMTENAPDLVLSDVVMPGGSGYDLCRRIKEDLQLCHIPVILVTAKASTENQVEGLNTGADAYVTKPFDPKYLLALIQSLLKNREKVRSLLNRATHVDKIDGNVLSAQDNAFMTDLYKLMEQELPNSELDIAKMTTSLGISRTKFYYKVKGLTGESPGVFFKTYKLNRAAELIKEGRNTVSEIAWMTGFSTLSHFSTVFKKQFGVAPSEYGKHVVQ